MNRLIFISIFFVSFAQLSADNSRIRQEVIAAEQEQAQILDNSDFSIVEGNGPSSSNGPSALEQFAAQAKAAGGSAKGTILRILTTRELNPFDTLILNMIRDTNTYLSTPKKNTPGEAPGEAPGTITLQECIGQVGEFSVLATTTKMLLQDKKVTEILSSMGYGNTMNHLNNIFNGTPSLGEKIIIKLLDVIVKVREAIFGPIEDSTDVKKALLDNIGDNIAKAGAEKVGEVTETAVQTKLEIITDTIVQGLNSLPEGLLSVESKKSLTETIRDNAEGSIPNAAKNAREITEACTNYAAKKGLSILRERDLLDINKLLTSDGAKQIMEGFTQVKELVSRVSPLGAIINIVSGGYKVYKDYNGVKDPSKESARTRQEAETLREKMHDSTLTSEESATYESAADAYDEATTAYRNGNMEVALLYEQVAQSYLENQPEEVTSLLEKSANALKEANVQASMNYLSAVELYHVPENSTLGASEKYDTNIPEKVQMLVDAHINIAQLSEAKRFELADTAEKLTLLAREETPEILTELAQTIEPFSNGATNVIAPKEGILTRMMDPINILSAVGSLGQAVASTAISVGKYARDVAINTIKSVQEVPTAKKKFIDEFQMVSAEAGPIGTFLWLNNQVEGNRAFAQDIIDLIAKKGSGDFLNNHLPNDAAVREFVTKEMGISKLTVTSEAINREIESVNQGLRMFFDGITAELTPEKVGSQAAQQVEQDLGARTQELDRTVELPKATEPKIDSSIQATEDPFASMSSQELIQDIALAPSQETLDALQEELENRTDITPQESLDAMRELSKRETELVIAEAQHTAEQNAEQVGQKKQQTDKTSQGETQANQQSEQGSQSTNDLDAGYEVDGETYYDADDTLSQSEYDAAQEKLKEEQENAKTQEEYEQYEGEQQKLDLEYDTEEHDEFYDAQETQPEGA